MTKEVKINICACGFSLTRDNIACDEHLERHSKWFKKVVRPLGGKKEGNKKTGGSI